MSAVDEIAQWAQESRERLQKRADAMELPAWRDIRAYGFRRSTLDLDDETVERVRNSALPKTTGTLHPDEEVWATQERVDANKVASIPLDGSVLLLKHDSRTYMLDGHHRGARAKEEGKEIEADIYHSDLIAKHLQGEHDQADHAPTKEQDQPWSERIQQFFDRNFAPQGEEQWLEFDAEIEGEPAERLRRWVRGEEYETQVAKHRIGQHDQKTHGRWAHDAMRFSAEIAGEEVAWSANRVLNPSGSTIMDLLGNPEAESFKYRDNKRKPGIALLWNDDTGDAVLMSTYRGRPSARKLIPGERMVRRGKLFTDNVLAAHRKGKQVEQAARQALPDEVVREIDSQLSRGASRAIAGATRAFGKAEGFAREVVLRERMRRIIEDNLTERDDIHHRTGGRWEHEDPERVRKHLLGWIRKHLQGQHDQKTHGLRGGRKISATDPAIMSPPDFLTDGVAKWMADHGFDGHDRDWASVRQDHDFQMAIAGAYDEMPIYDPGAEASYQAFVDETAEQFEFVTKGLGISFETSDSDPYRNAIEASRDVRENKRLVILSTDVTGGHPYMTNEENDQFRFVHDIFGHVATGRDFDRHGEEAAWMAHSAMYSDDAKPAMTSETRGQNAMLIRDKEFPDQKVGLMPEWTWTRDVNKRFMVWITKHDGPEDHDTGTSQDVHGNRGKSAAELDEEQGYNPFDEWVDEAEDAYEGWGVKSGLAGPGREDLQAHEGDEVDITLSGIWGGTRERVRGVLSRDEDGLYRLKPNDGGHKFDIDFFDDVEPAKDVKRGKTAENVVEVDFVERVRKLISKHLEGEHDQDTHGRRGGVRQQKTDRYPGENSTSHIDHLFERVQRAWESNDLGLLFPSGDIAVTPWPRGGRRKSRGSYDRDIVQRAVRDPKLDEVDPRWLHATQPQITRGGVVYYLEDDTWRKTGQTYADRGNPGNAFPFIYAREDGQNLILAGHHRAAASLLKGEPLVAIYEEGPWG